MRHKISLLNFLIIDKTIFKYSIYNDLATETKYIYKFKVFVNM